ncbi:SGNH/GDSL hydrolase family protein [Lactobacillaceae bacterium 24-114]
MKKQIKWLLIVMALCLIGLGGFFGYRYYHSQTTQQVKWVQRSQVKLVAIGDSLTYGQGDETKNGGYVGIIKNKIQNKYKKTKVTTINYGVSGDRSDQILARINKQKQIRTDLKSANVITVTVGGNDLMQILEKNALAGSESQIKTSVNNGQKTYEKNLTKLFNAIRKENKTAPIFVLSIYNPVYTYFPNVTIINDSIDQWNQATKGITTKYSQMYFVDINHLMSYGQYKTSEQRQKLIDNATQTNQGKISQTQVIKIMNNKDHNLNQYISTEDNFHPNHSGYEQMANKLFKSMVKHNSWEFEKE